MLRYILEPHGITRFLIMFLVKKQVGKTKNNKLCEETNRRVMFLLSLCARCHSPFTRELDLALGNHALPELTVGT